MEFGLGGDDKRLPSPMIPGQQHRAGWWFKYMRQVVARVIPWEPVPQARPEQTWFAGVNRQVSLSPTTTPNTYYRTLQIAEERCFSE